MTARTMKGGSLLTQKSAFRSSKNSEAGVVRNTVNSHMGQHTNNQIFGNISDSDQLLLLEQANHITTSHSHHPYYARGNGTRNKPESFPDVKKNSLMTEGF